METFRLALTLDIYGEIERELKFTGFWESIPARNKLISDLQRVLLQPTFSKLSGIVTKTHHQPVDGNR